MLAARSGGKAKAATAVASSSYRVLRSALAEMSLSSTRESEAVSSKPGDEVDPSDHTPSFVHPQSFVKVRLEPGEWDPGKRDPTYRPPWNPRKEEAPVIMSAEDFANRPRVGFSPTFESLHDGMVVLSWLSRKDCDDIYQLYLDMMTTMSTSDSNATSHEYVMRVISQKFGITAIRAAAVVQLAHNEDQMRASGRALNHKMQDFVDARARDHIRATYAQFKEPDPEQFLEEPVGVTGGGDPERIYGQVVKAEDLLDVDALMDDTIVREREEAQLAIDNKIYIEDVDDSKRESVVNAKCLKLIKKRMTTAKGVDQKAKLVQESLLSSQERAAKRRPRFKFAAQIISDSDKKKTRKTKGATNIIVEHNGTLRLATVLEVESTCWKSKRHEQEFIYHGVKKAWLDRTLHGKVGGWGRVEDKQDADSKDTMLDDALSKLLAKRAETKTDHPATGEYAEDDIDVDDDIDMDDDIPVDYDIPPVDDDIDLKFDMDDYEDTKK